MPLLLEQAWGGLTFDVIWSRVKEIEFRVQGLGFRVWGSRFRVWGVRV